MGRTKKECSELEHVDLCGGSCWGTQKLRKKNGTGEYVGTCKFPCRLKEECIKASREEQENVQYSIANISYNPVIGDSEDGNDGIKEPVAEEQTRDIPEDYIERFLREHKCPKEMAPAFRDAFNQFFFMLEKMPRFTKVLSGAIVGKMSQAELARCEGLTRQAINIGISNEITKMVAPPTVTSTGNAEYMPTSKLLLGTICLRFLLCFAMMEITSSTWSSFTPMRILM